MSQPQPQKIDQLHIEILEVKSALAGITELLNEQREGLAAFGKALQDCVEVLQPAGHPLRADVTPQQPAGTVQPVTQPPQQPAIPVQPAAKPASPFKPVPVQPKPSEPATTPAVKPGMHRIGDLKEGDKKVNVTAKVVTVNAERTVSSGDRVTEATLSDDTGTIQLSLWNDHIDLVQEDSIVSVEKGYVTSFRDQPVLNVGKWGTLKVEAPP